MLPEADLENYGGDGVKKLWWGRGRGLGYIVYFQKKSMTFLLFFFTY